MYNKMMLRFFSETKSVRTDKECFDFHVFKNQTQNEIQALQNEDANQQWNLFCNHIHEFSTNKSEKLLLMKLAFSCLGNPVESGDLSQLITLMRHLKKAYGLQIIHALLKAEVVSQERILKNYLQICQLLLDLVEAQGILSVVKSTLPNLGKLIEKLHTLHEEYLAKKYPNRDLDSVLRGFSEKNALVQFTLEKEELAQIKSAYLTIMKEWAGLKALPQAELAFRFRSSGLQWRGKQDLNAKCLMIAVLAETLRRQFGIVPYDTQLVTILALVNTPEQLKGRIGQIKTGEGKSTLIAMLIAFMAGQDFFVDMVTSSRYLANRDCAKYQPFYEALGLSASSICHHKQKQEHFHAQILYGTNTDFEFALLRDGLYHLKLRYSYNLAGQFMLRPFDVVVIDEVDNLFLDTALNSAQMGITDFTPIAWIYSPILDFVQFQTKPRAITHELIHELRTWIHDKISHEEQILLAKLNDQHLKRWYQSAHTALHEKMENRDYVIQPKREQKKNDTLEITIVDYANTGRTNQGSQWQHGIHQFLQIKHGLKLTPPSKTAASISHPAYFNQYQYILGLAGTMGEKTEREEIQTIYGVDSFDAPPTFPSQRIRHSDYLTLDRKAKWTLIFEELTTIQKRGQPALVLFKTIDESNAFGEFLRTKQIKHQLLNETQKEAEDYLVGQAGEAGVITIATNTAGRGTDIILSPESKEAGGLEVLFTFYPDNLRVEEQGLGRAGRQGQPGGARMIVSLEDETIMRLLQIDHPFSILFRLSALEHCARHKESLKQESAAPLMTMLNTLRTCSIQCESTQRLRSSQQEKLYYEKLQDFFVQMIAVYQLVESDGFSTVMHDICSSNQYYEQPDAPFEPHHPNWQNVQIMAHSLVEKHSEGVTVDWSALITRFKETYLMHIRSLWATYYDKLKDEIEVENVAQAQEKIASFLQAPLAKATAIMNAILAKEVFSLVQEQQSFGM